MERLPPPYHDLIISRHAQWRMHTRHITLDEVHNAIKSGRKLGQRSNTLHYDPTTWVGVVINWPARTIITVMNVWLCLSIPDSDPEFSAPVTENSEGNEKAQG